MSKRRYDSKLIYPYIKGKCRVCHEKLSGRRRTFCSQKCVDKLIQETDWSEIRKRVFERDCGRCQICGLELDNKALNGYHVDHIHPVSKGGNPYDMSNLQLTCVECNLKKGAKLDVSVP
jgi:5-methylcytosine-specific restriction endonuclease McrA